MKKHITLFVLLILSISFGFSQNRSERKKAKKEKLEAGYQKTKTLIDSGQFEFVADWANPLGNDVAIITAQLPAGGAGVFQGNRVSLTSNPNLVKINGNTAVIILPYFGRVFIPKINTTNGNGVNFDGEIDDYKVDYNTKKQRISIRFSSKSNTDNNDYQLTVSAGGSARLTLSSSSRQTISYDGVLSALVPDKE